MQNRKERIWKKHTCMSTFNWALESSTWTFICNARGLVLVKYGISQAALILFSYVSFQHLLQAAHVTPGNWAWRLLLLVSCLAYSSTLMIGSICSSENIYIFHGVTIPEDRALYSHWSGNLRSKKLLINFSKGSSYKLEYVDSFPSLLCFTRSPIRIAHAILASAAHPTPLEPSWLQPAYDIQRAVGN